MLAKFVDEKFPRWAKILLSIFGGAAVVYRVFLFVDDCIAKKESKNVKALVVAILCLVTFGILAFVLMICDIVTLAMSNEFKVLTFKE